MTIGNQQESRQSDFFDICCKCQDGCCSGARPPVTEKRKKIIQSFLEAKRIKMTDPFVKRGYSFPKETSEGYCIFWNKTSRKCQVQPVKPETCVAGPITFDIDQRTKKIEYWLKKEAICPLAGALYRRKEALNNHAKSAKTEILQLIQDLDREELRAILKVEEPETFKIDEDVLDSRLAAALKC